MKTLYLVIPCYNEIEVLEETSKVLKSKMEELIKNKKIKRDSKVLFVNDGSKDRTWDVIKELNKKDNLFTGISLSSNKGHQNALFAGLMIAKSYADVVVTMDADLQDDIDALDSMLDKYEDGYEIVYGVRSSRDKDSFLKRNSAKFFYKFMQLMGVDIVYNHADYRLASKRVLDELENYNEVNLFLRGIFPLMGFDSEVIYYERKERIAGKSKYTLKKMISFALDGITSFTVKPLRLICSLGFIVLLISFGIMLYAVIQKLLGNTVDGWTFLTISIWFIGGLQMTAIGVIGEYIGKIYSETKSRPRYIISESLIKNIK